ncbi:putative Nucleoside phosphorylase domain-containing protein [Seiridium cardinale]
MASAEILSGAYQQWAMEERSEACEEVAGRLRGRSGGLLELQLHQHNRPERASDSDAMVVELMHRSVFELLEYPEVWDLPSLRIAAESYVEASALSVLKLQGCIRSLDYETDRPKEYFLEAGTLPGDARIEVYQRDVLPRLVFINSHTRRPRHFHASLLGVERGKVNFVKEHPALLQVVREAKFPAHVRLSTALRAPTSCLARTRKYAATTPLRSKSFSKPGRIQTLPCLLVNRLGIAGCRKWLNLGLCWRKKESQLAPVDMTMSFLDLGACLVYHGTTMAEFIRTVFPRKCVTEGDPEVLSRVESLKQLVLRLEHAETIRKGVPVNGLLVF